MCPGFAQVVAWIGCPWPGSTSSSPLQWYLFSSLCLNFSLPLWVKHREWTYKGFNSECAEIQIIQCRMSGGKKRSVFGFSFWRCDRRPHRKLLKTLELFTVIWKFLLIFKGQSFPRQSQWDKESYSGQKLIRLQTSGVWNQGWWGQSCLWGPISWPLDSCLPTFHSKLSVFNIHERKLAAVIWHDTPLTIVWFLTSFQQEQSIKKYARLWKGLYFLLS